MTTKLTYFRLAYTDDVNGSEYDASIMAVDAADAIARLREINDGLGTGYRIR